MRGAELGGVGFQCAVQGLCWGSVVQGCCPVTVHCTGLHNTTCVLAGCNLGGAHEPVSHYAAWKISKASVMAADYRCMSYGIIP